jgi:hypothetical protein
MTMLAEPASRRAWRAWVGCAAMLAAAVLGVWLVVRRGST